MLRLHPHLAVGLDAQRTCVAELSVSRVAPPDNDIMASAGYTKLEEAEDHMSSAGLTTAQAEAATKKWGKNEIPEEKEPVRELGYAPNLHTTRRVSCPPPARAPADGRASRAPVTFAALEDVRDAVRRHDAGDD